MLRHRFPLVSLHGFRQAQKFALEMVEGIFAVIQRPPISKRIFGIKQDGIQSAGDSEDPRQTNGSQRLESIGILNYFRLQRARWDRRAEAVRLDGMADRRVTIRRKISKGRLQNGEGFSRRPSSRIDFAPDDFFGKLTMS